jgi:hypothetical protein
MKTICDTLSLGYGGACSASYEPTAIVTVFERPRSTRIDFLFTFLALSTSETALELKVL